MNQIPLASIGPVVAPGVMSPQDPTFVPVLPPQSTPTGATESVTIESLGSKPIEFRVLHLVNGEHFSGAERVQSHLGRCLPRFGVTADFACLKPGRFADMLDEQEGRWGTCYRFGMKHRFDLGIARRIAAQVEAGQYDLLHAHTPRTAMICALVAKQTQRPWVYHVHSPAARDSTRLIINRINAWIEARALKKCSHIVTVSESLGRELCAQGMNRDRVTVVHNGVPAIRPVRQSVPTVGGRWTLAMVALMRPRKGLESVLEAMAQLAVEGHDVQLRCIGPFETEEYARQIERKINRLGLDDRIHRSGFTTDVPRELASVDALVLPSLFGEGLPMVVLEAMAAGLPVIATCVEGTPEAIRDGVDGLLAEPRSGQSLAAAIRCLITGKVDWEKMSQSAVRRHAERFSDWTMAAATAAVYQRLLKPKLAP